VDAGRHVTEKFTTNKFAACRPRKPDRAFITAYRTSISLHMVSYISSKPD